MMRALLAVSALAIAMPAAAERYSGYYTSPCGRLQCDLRIEPAGADNWHLAWAAIDPRDPSLTPVCEIDADVAIGEVMVGDMIVGGVAVGKARGEPVALFDLEPGRASIRTEAACEGIRLDGIYGSVGD